MHYTIIGLGNPGPEYENSRHNSGKTIVENLRRSFGFSDWKMSKKNLAEVSEGLVGKEKTVLIRPEVFMNASGKAVLPFCTSKKAAKSLIVVYDDLDLPIGAFKISFNRGSGGHRGLESIIRALKTKEFLRVRVGISPATPSGKIKKPAGEKKVIDFILGSFRPKENELIKKVSKQIIKAIEVLIAESKEKAMSLHN